METLAEVQEEAEESLELLQLLLLRLGVESPLLEAFASWVVADEEEVVGPVLRLFVKVS